MALRTIRVMGDEILTKQCRPVKEMTPRIKTLIEDMLETMYDAEGVGLAAPQVGILKQICVIDVTPECDHPIVLVNPEIIELSGEQIGPGRLFECAWQSWYCKTRQLCESKSIG